MEPKRAHNNTMLFTREAERRSHTNALSLPGHSSDSVSSTLAAPNRSRTGHSSQSVLRQRYIHPKLLRPRLSNESIQWDVPLLEGYEYEFLPALGRKERISFWQPMNYGLSSRLKAGHFDALWVHGYMRWHHWVAMAAAKRLGMKVLVRDEATPMSKSAWNSEAGGKEGVFRLVAPNRGSFPCHRIAKQLVIIANMGSRTIPYS